MAGLLWALFFGCAITFVTLMLLYASAGLRKRLVDRFSEAQVSYFFHVVKLWAVFLFLMWLGWSALTHYRDSYARPVLGLYVLATSIGAVFFLDWLRKQKERGS
jgi:predicted signal transduction protein with EAL and GGDEF domain